MQKIRITVYCDGVCVKPCIQFLWGNNKTVLNLEVKSTKSMHKNNRCTQFCFLRLTPFSITPVQKHISLGHAGIADHSVWFIFTKLKKNMQKEWTETSLKKKKLSKKINKCIMANTSAIWQQAAHTTDQPSSSNCSTRAIQKSLYLKNKTTTKNTKGQENGPPPPPKKKKKKKKSREKEQQGLAEEQETK